MRVRVEIAATAGPGPAIARVQLPRADLTYEFGHEPETPYGGKSLHLRCGVLLHRQLDTLDHRALFFGADLLSPLKRNERQLEIVRSLLHLCLLTWLCRVISSRHSWTAHWDHSVPASPVVLPISSGRRIRASS
jgi:hypothetical protein